MSRIAYLVFIAMLMFTAGIVVVVTAHDFAEHALGTAAILGAAAVVLANVTNHKGDDP